MVRKRRKTGIGSQNEIKLLVQTLKIISNFDTGPLKRSIRPIGTVLLAQQLILFQIDEKLKQLLPSGSSSIQNFRGFFSEWQILTYFMVGIQSWNFAQSIKITRTKPGTLSCLLSNPFSALLLCSIQKFQSRCSTIEANNIIKEFGTCSSQKTELMIGPGTAGSYLSADNQVCEG